VEKNTSDIRIIFSLPFFSPAERENTPHEANTKGDHFTTDIILRIPKLPGSFPAELSTRARMRKRTDAGGLYRFRAIKRDTCYTRAAPDETATPSESAGGKKVASSRNGVSEDVFSIMSLLFLPPRIVDALTEAPFS
jgi:hypothetical protein